jgi:glycosyltransferase involved in cell wall biosynthesis
MTRVLMIAFHFPPYQGSSGMLRTWSFARHLPASGCEPLVLTASASAYGPGDERPGGLQIPENLRVWRAASLDAARHFAFRGRYLRWTALPDRWGTWCLPAVIRALAIARAYRPHVIWSTYPIATAHLVGLLVQRLTGLPWVADFRDSMTEPGYPDNPLQHMTYRWIERSTIERARALVFTTEGARRMYAERYGEEATRRFLVIRNGYSEENFRRAERIAGERRAAPAREPLMLVHSGILYPSERDPRPFFEALAHLKAEGRIGRDSLRVVLRASGYDTLIGSLIDSFGIADIVSLAGPIGYDAALVEMLSADALLLFQAANCNHQIPAKLYEYLRSGRPVFALTDSKGDTAAELRGAGIDTIADLASAADIREKLPRFLDALRAGSAPVADAQITARLSRETQASDLAALLASAREVPVRT